ncbi:MAG: sulfatase-like hydrolase/transferase [Terriglobales bacterium]
MSLALFLTLSVGGTTTTQTASSPPVTARSPNIILITLDTTRADRMGFLGSKRGLTPNLDALAKQSVVFTRAYAQVPLTTPSHAALLTGTYPQFNHLNDLGEPLREDLPYVPDLFHQSGYHTAAFIGSMVLDPESGAATGFDRGFDVYDAGFHNPRPGEDRYQSLERRAEDVADRAMSWLSRNQRGPFFLWLHFYDPHHPYDPPEPFKTQYVSAPYDGEIAYTDSVVGGLMDVLVQHGLFENCLIAIAADHGEALGEHGEMQHGMLLYDETIHVPLLLKLPEGNFAGKRIDTRVALADVAPSLLQAAGIPIPASVQAQSLFPLIEATESAAVGKGKVPESAIYSETDYAHHTFGWSELRSWRAGKYLYVQAPKKELYDQSSDPGAVKNLAPTAKAVADTLGAQLSDFRQKTSSIPGKSAKLNASQAESLHALGYIASDAGSTNSKGKSLVNPKNKIAIVNRFQEALFDLEQERYSKAMAEFREVARDPDAVNAYLEFGIAMAREQQFQYALPLLRTAASKLPESVVAHYELAKALVNTGQWAAALPEMRAASVLKPDSAQFHFFTAAVYGHLMRVPEAIAEYKKALEIDPDYFDANLTYGRLLLQMGHPNTALPKLSQAVKVNPESPAAHWFLAEAYQQLGQAEDANRERAKAGDFHPPAPNK